jgi:hypothetical protein
MSATLVPTSSCLEAQRATLEPVPWRDLHAVPPAELRAYIESLEAACLERPESAALRVCLGLAHAVNLDVYKSMDALEAAIEMDPTSFWAQLKYAELHLRLRALIVAERETEKALDLAQNAWQLAVARRQLQTARALNRASTRNVTFDRPLIAPSLVLAGMLALTVVGMTWKW